MAAQGEGGVDVADAGTGVDDVHIHPALLLPQYNAHLPAGLGIQGVFTEVGQGVVHKFTDDFGKAVEVSGDGLPQLPAIGSVFNGEGFQGTHTFHSFQGRMAACSENKTPCRA